MPKTSFKWGIQTKKLLFGGLYVEVHVVVFFFYWSHKNYNVVCGSRAGVLFVH